AHQHRHRRPRAGHRPDRRGCRARTARVLHPGARGPGRGAPDGGAPRVSDLVLADCRLPDGAVVDVACRHGRIAAIRRLGGASAPGAIRCEGRPVTPGLVESHIHLDKALLSDRAPSEDGTLAEAIRVTGEAKRSFTVEDIRTRARAVLELALRNGTTA